MHNLKQLLIAADQFIYCLCGSLLSVFNRKIKVYADMTLSAQAYRLEQQGKRCGKFLRLTIDLLFRPFEKEHCRLSFESEKDRTQLPEDMR